MEMWLLLPVLVFLLWNPSSKADVGPPLLHSSSDKGPALFSWKMAFADISNLLVIVDSPGEYEVFNIYGEKKISFASNYKDRVKNASVTDDTISFSLANVTTYDAGNYTCREGHRKERVIPKCGQFLYVLDHGNYPVMPKGSQPLTLSEGQSVTLTCVGAFDWLPVPKSGYSWNFSPPDGISSVRQLEKTGYTLTLDLLTPNRSGHYSCQAKEDADYNGTFPVKSSIHLTVVATPAVGPGKSESGTGANFEVEPILTLLILAAGVLIVLAI